MKTSADSEHAALSQPTWVRYRVVLLTTSMSVLLYLDRFCLTFVERFLKEDLSLSDQQIGLLLSAFFWVYALAQVPSGWLSDRWGARRMLALYILLWSLATGLMGLATTFAMLIPSGCVERDAPVSAEQISAVMAAPNAKAAVKQADSSRADRATESTNEALASSVRIRCGAASPMALRSGKSHLRAGRAYSSTSASAPGATRWIALSRA